MNRHQYIDLGYINEIADGDRDFVIEMINDYLLMIPEYIRELNRASLEKNKESTGFFAHKLASSFLVMGARNLNEVAIKIEHGIKSDLPFEELPAHLEAIDTLFEKVVTELKQELQHLNT